MRYYKNYKGLCMNQSIIKYLIKNVPKTSKCFIFMFEGNIFGGGGEINLHIFQNPMALIIYHTKTSYSKENIRLLLCRTNLNVLWRLIISFSEVFFQRNILLLVNATCSNCLRVVIWRTKRTCEVLSRGHVTVNNQSENTL